MEDQGLTHASMEDTTQSADVEIGLSLSQREIWLDQSAWPDSAHLNIGGGAFLHGKFDIVLFKLALARLVAENQALRLVPRPDGSQLLLGKFEPKLEFFEIDAGNEPLQAMRDWWNHQIKIPFSLGDVPPWRFALLRASDDLHGLTIQFHHLIMDGWGTTLVMQRWSALYNALLTTPSTASTAGADYLDFIAESSHYRNSLAFASDFNFWLDHVPRLPTPLIDQKFHLSRQSGLMDCEIATVQIARDQYEALASSVARRGATMFNLFLATIATYFSRITQRTEIVIGVPSLNRIGRRQRGTMGMFVGVMPIKVTVDSGTTPAALLTSIATTIRSALRHSRFPLSELGRRLDLIRAGRDSIFDVLLSFERQDYQLQFGDARLQDSRQLFSGKARFPLGATVCEFHDGEDIELVLEGSRAYFEPGETEMLAQRLWALANSMMSSPDTPLENLSVLPPAEQSALIGVLSPKAESDDTTVPYIVQFERYAASSPSASAVVWGQESIDYATLNERANRLARRLMQFAPTSRGIVALAIERSVDMVLAILAISKCGAAFLPLDPDIPVARISEILADSGASIFLIKAQDQERLAHLHRRTVVVDWDIADTNRLPIEVARRPEPTDLAYVLFTSGSTGSPKGVMIDHATLSHRLKWLSRAYAVTPLDCAAQATQITFDPSLIELFLPLVNGARVALPPPGRLLPESLADFATAHSVTIMAFVPSTLSRFLDSAIGMPGLKLRVACCGGEVLAPDLANRYLTGTKARLLNVYGPTETAIFATAWECVPVGTATALPIGKPISNTRIYILDGKKNLMPFGAVGEIYIGGEAVALGYLNRAELTATAFIADPFTSTGRMYKTGDRGWLSMDGNLNFVGRNDRQVKLRGYRIELGEIEAALCSVEGVLQAAAKLIEHEGKSQIHAWVASHAGHTPGNLQNSLRLRLPSYMIPGGIEILPQLPESSVGKIDYLALPTPNFLQSTTPSRAPDNRLEADLLILWQKVMNRPDLTVSDNFFEFGGDSLAAVSILTGIEKIIGRRVPMYLITERPTIEGLAAALGEGTASTGLMVRLGIDPEDPGVQRAQRTVLYLAASGHGDLMRFQTLAQVLIDTCEIRMLQPPSASTIAKTVDLAKMYANVVKTQGAGPCYLAGFSVGGLAAVETSRQLIQNGIEVKALFLVDTIFPSRLWGGTFLWRLLRRFVAAFHIQDLSMNGRRLGVMLNDSGLFSQVMAVSGYRAAKLECNVHLIKSAGLATRMNGLLFYGWRRLLGQRLQEHTVKGIHGSMFDATNIDGLANVIRTVVNNKPERLIP